MKQKKWDFAYLARMSEQGKIAGGFAVRKDTVPSVEEADATAYGIFFNMMDKLPAQATEADVSLVSSGGDLPVELVQAFERRLADAKPIETIDGGALRAYRLPCADFVRRKTGMVECWLFCGKIDGAEHSHSAIVVFDRELPGAAGLPIKQEGTRFAIIYFLQSGDFRHTNLVSAFECALGVGEQQISVEVGARAVDVETEEAPIEAPGAGAAEDEDSFSENFLQPLLRDLAQTLAQGFLHPAPDRGEQSDREDWEFLFAHLAKKYIPGIEEDRIHIAEDMGGGFRPMSEKYAAGKSSGE